MLCRAWQGNKLKQHLLTSVGRAHASPSSLNRGWLRNYDDEDAQDDDGNVDEGCNDDQHDDDDFFFLHREECSRCDFGATALPPALTNALCWPPKDLDCKKSSLLAGSPAPQGHVSREP